MQPAVPATLERGVGGQLARPDAPRACMRAVAPVGHPMRRRREPHPTIGREGEQVDDDGMVSHDGRPIGPVPVVALEEVATLGESGRHGVQRVLGLRWNGTVWPRAIAPDGGAHRAAHCGELAVAVHADPARGGHARGGPLRLRHRHVADAARGRRRLAAHAAAQLAAHLLRLLGALFLDLGLTAKKQGPRPKAQAAQHDEDENASPSGESAALVSRSSWW